MWVRIYRFARLFKTSGIKRTLKRVKSPIYWSKSIFLRFSGFLDTFRGKRSNPESPRFRSHHFDNFGLISGVTIFLDFRSKKCALYTISGLFFGCALYPTKCAPDPTFSQTLTMCAPDPTKCALYPTKVCAIYNRPEP